MTEMESAARRLDSAFRGCGVCMDLTLPSGATVRVGGAEPAAKLVLKTGRAARALLSLNEDALAEAYVRGEVDVAGDFAGLLGLRRAMRPAPGFASIWRFLRPLLRGQRATNADAIGRHYELDADFYLSFLDRRWPAYSQGIYESPDESLEAATARKFEVAAKACRAGPGSHVLEVGPGWGAFLRYLLPTGARVTALTNSAKMKRYLDGLLGDWNGEVAHADFLSFRPQRRFTALTMMGVLEHVPQYERACRQFRTLLEPGSFVYLDASAATVKYAMSSFIYRHVFPYNHSFLHLASFLAAAKREQLRVVDVQDDSENYHRTIVQWARNFEASREELERRYAAYDVRRFRLYLWGSAHAFEMGKLQCYRVVLQTPG